MALPDSAAFALTHAHYKRGSRTHVDVLSTMSKCLTRPYGSDRNCTQHFDILGLNIVYMCLEGTSGAT